MLRRRLARRTISLLVMLLVAANSRAADPPDALTSMLKRLASQDDSERKAALAAMEKDGDARLVPALIAYRDGLLAVRENQVVIYGSRVEIEGHGKLYPVLDALTLAPITEKGGQAHFEESLPPDVLRAPRAYRTEISNLISSLSLLDPNPAKRKAAIIDAGDRADEKSLKSLESQLEKDPSGRFAAPLRESIARIHLAHGSREQKLAAVSELGKLASGNGGMSLRKALEALEKSPQRDPQLEQAIHKSLQTVESYQKKIRFIHNTFAGLSLTSILILMALGLAIIFGLMGVINMAHGEFMMIGAFTTYVVAETFRRHMPGAYDWYMLAAVPAAFLVSAIAGYFCERLIIRHLYGRPLETLLATWGLSLILIQAARVYFGDTLSVASPNWLQGGWEVAPDLVLPALRLFIIGFCAVCVTIVFMVIRFTSFGLLLRATTQNREIASALGVSTRRVDGLTFAFGTGLAGLAGVIVPLYNKLNPNIGQEYIVESFMVVVVGGVGNFFGVLLGGAGLGFLSKYIEPLYQSFHDLASSASVLGRVTVLILVILFLNWKPSGLFPARGRLADA
jgi:urea transport system permease protein